VQVAGSAGKVLVSGLSRVDSWLEQRGLLGKLQPAEVPAEVRGKDGQLNEECQEVRGLGERLVAQQQQQQQQQE
jgi:hypothetical protein